MSEIEHQVTIRAPIIEEVEALFPAYDIHSLIACGGMGAVYHATQLSLDRAVAIKILPREFSSDEAFRTGFELEAKAMAKLNHPNLIGVYDFGEAGGMLFIIMEYVAGKSLFHSANGFAVEQAQALEIIIEVCDGLAHAHEFGILHRDIKPGNILLDAQARPKIGDFGLARALEREIQEGEQIFGTPGYTAPEVTHPPFTFDHRADIFSVGVMLHELLTGKLPDRDPRPASQICGCNPRLDVLIRKATHPDQNARYGSATELATELEKISSSPARSILTAGSPAAPGRPYISPRPAPVGRSYSPPRPTKKSSSGRGFLVVLVVIAAAIAYFAMNRNTIAQTRPGVDSAQETSPEPGTQPTPVSPVHSVSETPASLGGFDTGSYLERARSSIRRVLAPSTEAHRKALSSNTRDLEAALVDSLTRIEDLDARATAAAALARRYSAWKADRNRISEELPGFLSSVSGASDVHSVHLENQQALEDRINEEISIQSSSYILEIENQIGKLNEVEDQAAIEALKNEIDLTRNDPGYLRAHILR